MAEVDPPPLEGVKNGTQINGFLGRLQAEKRDVKILVYSCIEITENSCRVEYFEGS